MLESMKYVRKPFYVDAVQVTGRNINDIANWCRGELVVDPKDQRPYVKVRVQRALNDNQTRAYIGTWVLYAGTSFKVYTDKAFRTSFEQHSVGTTLIETFSNVDRDALDEEELELEAALAPPVTVPIPTGPTPAFVAPEPTQ